jgi:phospholipid/cholesterol/gamma-HCH transport system substrate-binding protein
MERHANYALVGALSLALIIGLAVFVVWLAGSQFDRDYDPYDIVFLGSVQGLSEGGDVYFNGIKVGEVTKLSLDRNDPNRVVARVRLDGDTPVRVDSIARLEPLGVTGVNIIQISAGASRRMLKNTVADNEVPVIRSAPSAFTGLLEGGGTVLARTVTALDNVNRLLSPENITRLSATLENVQDVSADLAARERLLDNLDATIRSTNQTAIEVTALARDSRRLVNDDARQVLDEAEATASELKLAAQDARAMVAELRAPARDFATTGLPQLTQSLISLQQAAESLERVVSDIGANPRSLLTTGESREREVAP